MLKHNKNRSKKLNYRVKNQRYLREQLYSHLLKCEKAHQYGHLELAGPQSIPAKVCKVCTFLLYKDEVVKRNELLRANRPKQHIDLFQF